MAKSSVEKIEDIEKQMVQLRNQKKMLLSKKREEERKARTRRLIERGAILESLLNNPESLTNEEVQNILTYAMNTPYVREYLKKLI